MRFVFALLVLSGCAYRTPAVNAPTAVALADVRVDGASPDEVRVELVEVLAPDVNADASAKVHVVVEQRRDVFDAMRDDGMAAMLLLFAPFGAYTGHARVAVAVDVSRDGITTSTHATESRFGSAYAPAMRRALAAALDRALVGGDGGARVEADNPW